MDPKAQVSGDEPTDELTDDQIDQVSGGLTKIGVGIPTL